MTIHVQRRDHDFIAWLNDDRSLYGCGSSEQYAIGDALWTRAQREGVTGHPANPSLPDVKIIIVGPVTALIAQ
jgi:hypothetical protein